MVLEKLTEIKDVKTYVKARRALLDNAHEEITENEPEEKRHERLQIIRGRKRELDKLMQVADNEGFKKYSQKHWDKVDAKQTPDEVEE